MAHRSDASIKRTIRRQQLRAKVPLADSTIYEMEQRGEFPRRFAVSPLRGLGSADVEAWLASRRSTAIARTPFSRRQVTALAPRSKAESSPSSGIEDGMKTGMRFLPSTKALMISTLITSQGCPISPCRAKGAHCSAVWHC